MGNRECYTQKTLKEGAEEFIKTKQVKYGNKTPDGGGKQKALVNIKGASYSLIMGTPTKEWYDLPSPGLIFWQTSSQ